MNRKICECVGKNLKFDENKYSKIFNSELILFAVAGDMNRNEVAKINSLINIGKEIIIVLNKIDNWNYNELKEIKNSYNKIY